MGVPKPLLPLKINRNFGPKTGKFCPEYAFLSTYRPCWLMWCPVGWFVGGCGERAVSRKTPIYFIKTIILINDFRLPTRFLIITMIIYMVIMTWPWPSPTWTCSCLAKVEASHLRTSSGTDSLTWRGNILINGKVTIASGTGGGWVVQNMNNDY